MKVQILQYIKDNPNKDGIDVSTALGERVDFVYREIQMAIDEGLISRFQTGFVTRLEITPAGCEWLETQAIEWAFDTSEDDQYASWDEDPGLW